MKKTIITIIMAVATISASAQEFRGFVDLFAGRCLFKTSKEVAIGNRQINKVTDDLTFGLYVTGGYQITPQWFAGIGFGGYTDMLGWHTDNYYDYDDNTFESIYLPIYADVRWTLDLQRKITPYADLKVGYQFGVNLGSGQMTWDNNGYIPCIGYKSTMLLQPGVGVRFGKKSGFNLGFAYNFFVGKKIMEYSASQPNHAREAGSITTGTLMLTFGADF